MLDLVEEILGTFGFNQYEVNLSTRPEKSVGDDQIWSTAEAALVEALNLKGWSYKVRRWPLTHIEGSSSSSGAAGSWHVVSGTLAQVRDKPWPCHGACGCASALRGAGRHAQILHFAMGEHT